MIFIKVQEVFIQFCFLEKHKNLSRYTILALKNIFFVIENLQKVIFFLQLDQPLHQKQSAQVC